MNNLRSHLKAAGRPPPAQQQSTTHVSAGVGMTRDASSSNAAAAQQPQPNFTAAASTSGGLSIDGTSSKAGHKKHYRRPDQARMMVSNLDPSLIFLL